MNEPDFLHEEPPLGRGDAHAPGLSRLPLRLSWDFFTIQSREDFCMGGGIAINLAQKKWDEMEPWLQFLLVESVFKRSRGRVLLDTHCRWHLETLTPENISAH